MRFSRVSTPISAPWFRSCELSSLEYRCSEIVLKVTDEIGGKWVLTFAELQATKVTTEECAGEILEILPEGGGAVYASETSDWLSFLGKGQIDFLSRSRHFVVPCYDEVVEIVAWEFQVTVGD